MIKINKYICISLKEILLVIAKTIVVLCILNVTFYKRLLAFIPLSILGVAFSIKEINELIKKKKNAICIEFKEFLSLSVTGLKAGYSVENAMINSYKDLLRLFGNSAPICKLLKELKASRSNNQSFKDVFIDMGNITQIEEIKEFGDIYSLAYQGSGTINQVMEKSAMALVEKIDMENEIYSILNERLYEMKIMNYMPFLIIGYISMVNPGYFDSLYSSIKGVVMMTGCLIIYVGAYFLSNRLTNIKI